MMAEEADTKLCNNCKRHISVSNFMMHEMHCKRHISMCEHCGEPIPKGEMEVHFEENHAKISCGKCGLQVEKMNLEDHEENSCPKKPMTCSYCQLEFPKNGLDEHLEYCGSRTEACKKCGQYIMLKDEVKHNQSNCAYPPVKPAGNNNNRVGVNGSGDLEEDYGYGGHQGLNPFAFDELSRVLAGHADPGNAATTNTRRQPELAARGTVPKVPSVPKAKEPANRGSLGKKTTSTTTATKTKKRPNVSWDKDTVPDEDVEYDRLLAMHLAQDLNEEEDIEALIRNAERTVSPVAPASPTFDYQQNFGFNSLTDVLIPCEFCGEPYPADDLVQHQSGCSLDRAQDMLSKVTGTQDLIGAKSGRMENNNPIPDQYPSNPAPQLGVKSPLEPSIKPSIVSDLRELDQMFGDPSEPLLDEDLMLPCEFCNELFPMDNLIQHQAICDSNTTMTPRVMSPAERRPKPNKKRSAMTTAEMLKADLPNLTSRRHQGPPTFGLIDSDEEMNEDRRERTKKKKPVNSSTGTFSGNVRTGGKKYGINGEERGDYFSRNSGSYKQMYNRDNERDLRLSSQQSTTRTGSAARTRSTLDNLLSDTDQNSSHDFFGHLGTKESYANTGVTRKPGVSSPAKPLGPGKGVTKTRSTAREVQRELDRQPSRPSNAFNPARTRATRPQLDLKSQVPDADENAAPNSRQRTRANNVFGAQARSTASRRRSENS